MTSEEKKEYHRNYYLQHKEKALALRKEYYLQHREKILEQVKEYNLENRDKRLEQQKAYHKQHYLDNKEKIDEYHRNLYWANREKEAERKKKYREQNPEKVRERNKKYILENPEKFKQTQRNYVKNNPDKNTIRSHRRRALQKGLRATLTVEQWGICKRYFENKCCYCGKEKKLEREHLIPVTKNGDYSANNIVPSCGSCNRSKASIDFFEWYRVQDFYLLEREEKILQYIDLMHNCQP
jgi:hypothetical protein